MLIKSPMKCTKRSGIGLDFLQSVLPTPDALAVVIIKIIIIRSGKSDHIALLFIFMAELEGLLSIVSNFSCVTMSLCLLF